MVHRVSDHMHQRVPDLLQHALVQPQRLSRKLEGDLLTALSAQIPDRSQEGVEHRGDGKHPYVHGLLLKLICQHVEPGVPTVHILLQSFQNGSEITDPSAPAGHQGRDLRPGGRRTRSPLHRILDGVPLSVGFLDQFQHVLDVVRDPASRGLAHHDFTGHVHQAIQHVQPDPDALLSVVGDFRHLNGLGGRFLRRLARLLRERRQLLKDRSRHVLI